METNQRRTQFSRVKPENNETADRFVGRPQRNQLRGEVREERLREFGFLSQIA